MCSITALLNRTQDADSDRQKVLEASLCQRHRGPDWSGVVEHPGAIIAHERLAIVDVLSGAQPMVDPEQRTVLAVNGEIYNHQELRASESAQGLQFSIRERLRGHPRAAPDMRCAIGRKTKRHVCLCPVRS